MRMQARLEDIYRAKMESNFCYLFPTVEQQVQYFRTRDFSIEPPQNEIEALLQKIVASSLGIKAEAVSVSAELMPLIGDISKAFALFDAIREVFAEAEIGEDFLRLTTIRQMADYARGRRRGLLSADAFSGNVVFPPQRLRAERAERPELLHLPQRPHGRRLPARRV